MPDGTVELTGHHRARRATDRELRATLKDFTTWHASLDRRPDRALESWGVRGDIDDRSLFQLGPDRQTLTESQQCRRTSGGDGRTPMIRRPGGLIG
ncbi:hypothetical protein N4G69_17090 [Streptomyces mirabilis]|uniref:hypothetical protein n=1 Tax=Streptomyces mirabilis TaxID=68239 RepID=UPI0021C13598|nr:hypothetical protein [Streptomyces mirabilis]MCT9107331.1 hypothetical protein [Streptomyces mirabilis]